MSKLFVLGNAEKADSVLRTEPDAEALKLLNHSILRQMKVLFAYTPDEVFAAVLREIDEKVVSTSPEGYLRRVFIAFKTGWNAYLSSKGGTVTPVASKTLLEDWQQNGKDPTRIAQYDLSPWTVDTLEQVNHAMSLPVTPTDYILGFPDPKDWESGILSSFMDGWNAARSKQIRGN